MRILLESESLADRTSRGLRCCHLLTSMGTKKHLHYGTKCLKNEILAHLDDLFEIKITLN